MFEQIQKMINEKEYNDYEKNEIMHFTYLLLSNTGDNK